MNHAELYHKVKSLVKEIDEDQEGINLTEARPPFTPAISDTESVYELHHDHVIVVTEVDGKEKDRKEVPYNALDEKTLEEIHNLFN